MIPVTNTKNMVGRSIGSVMRQNRCHDVAPSVRAAEWISAGMARMPARKNSATYPTLLHTTTADTTGSASPGSVSHSMRCPSSVLMAPSVGARIQRHNTPMANGTQIHGSTNSVRNTPLPGRSRASRAPTASPSTVCTGTTIATNVSVTRRELPKVLSVRTERQFWLPTYSIGPNRSQRCRLSHTTTKIGNSKKAATPNRLGASKAYPRAVDRRPAVTAASPTQVLNLVDTVGVVTPNRGIDADFLSLPRHELADAAL